MSEVVGLSWNPKLSSFSCSIPAIEAPSMKQLLPFTSPALSQLIDALFLPPNDPRRKLNKLAKKQVKGTTGKNWDAVDPKRHYKKGDAKLKTLPKYFQVGTLVELPFEFHYRLAKKERKATFADQLLFDDNLRAYRKRKVREIEEVNIPAGVNNWKKTKGMKHAKAGKGKEKGKRH